MPLALQRKLAEEELAKAKELNASEGFLLKNLEKDCKSDSFFQRNNQYILISHSFKKILECFWIVRLCVQFRNSLLIYSLHKGNTDME